MTDAYEAFLASKSSSFASSGIEVGELSDGLFPYQKDIVRWALAKGKAAIFADTGLGKTRMQIEWARHVADATGGDVLILAPLAVATQTSREGLSVGSRVTVCKDAGDANAGLNITNYDRMHKFDLSSFAGVVLDESSCLKDFTSATRNDLIDGFRETPYKLACTATPAPNDFTELGNHAEFLGVMSRLEMLSMWFVHDGGSTQDWRLKGHAVESFWKWVCSWACLIRRPSDLGYEDGSHLLPPLRIHDRQVQIGGDAAKRAGVLFVDQASGLAAQRAARKESISRRVEECAMIVNATPGNWLIWCELNDEGDALESAIDGSVQIAGSDSRETKEDRMVAFSEGRIRVLVTKPSIAGYGMNWQHCHQMAFVGVSHSFEQFYQAVRRCWRFGQSNPVDCYVITSDAEGAVVASLRRKEQDAANMAIEMTANTADLVQGFIRATERETTAYLPTKPMHVPAWLATQEES
jgi:superfamily II DNA or RNA helicase